MLSYIFSRVDKLDFVCDCNSKYASFIILGDAGK
jgi:hypothetical protein